MTNEKVEAKKVKKEWHPFLQGIFWSLVVSSIVSIFGLLGASLVLFSPFSDEIASFLNDKKEKITGVIKKSPSPSAATQPISESNNLLRAVNVLVLGIEPVLNESVIEENSAFKGQIDTALLLHFDPVDRSLKLLSIPRDSLLEMENGKVDRVKNFNIQNDGTATAKIISKNFRDLTIDRYLRLSTDAVAKLIEAVGGVEVFVPQAISYEDKTQKLKIELIEGWQTLNGEQTLQFARYLDDRGDLGRIQRQQIAIEAFQKRLQNPTMVTSLPEIINILRSNIDTNLDREEMLVLANFSAELQQDSLQMILLAGRTDSDGSWRIDQNERDRILSQFFGHSKTINSSNNNDLAGARITIQNTTRRSQLSQELLDYLRKHNFWNVRIIDDLPMELRETQIIDREGNTNLATQLKQKLNFGRINTSSTGDLDSEITIQIGEDFIIGK